MADPRATPLRLDEHVRDVLLGADHAPDPIERDIDDHWRLESAIVAEAMRRARESMLLLIPPTGEDPQRTLKRYPGPPPGSMEPDHVFEFAGGEKRRFRRTSSPLRLSIGRVGAAVDTTDGRRIMAVPWADCVGVVREPALRSLIGRDGTLLQVYEGDWKHGHVTTKLIDKYTPPALVVSPAQVGRR
jgi:hypothetical protein